MNDRVLTALRDLTQEDIGRRGLATDPACNLLTACAGDFMRACRHIAGTPHPAIAVVTGFYIPHAQPPAGETDGPLGALFLARALVPLGMRVVLVTDAFCARALEVGLAECELAKAVPVVTLPAPAECTSSAEYVRHVAEHAGPLTHLIALERVGPSHVHEAIPAEHRDRCHTMRGLDITDKMSPAHLLFEAAAHMTPAVATIGIGDGGNEIGMGKISRDVIERNIPRGGLVACRVPTDDLIVCGISNWGAYGLAAGVRYLHGQKDGPADLFDPERERQLLQVMVEQGPLVDGVKGMPSVTVDGIAFDRYGEILRQMMAVVD